MNKQRGQIDLALIGVIVALVALISAMAFATYSERTQWERFVVEHHCKVTEKQAARSYVGTGLTADGKMGVTTLEEPERWAWRCDDGITYWR